MKRYGQIIRIKPDKIETYKDLHANAWPEVLSRISDCNIRNYVIYLREPENLLFAHFEYHGTDFQSDMAKMAADPKVQAWWEQTDPCQEGLESRSDGEWWASMQEVFFHGE